MLISSEQNAQMPPQILLKRGLSDCFKLIDAHLNEEDKVCKCYYYHLTILFLCETVAIKDNF